MNSRKILVAIGVALLAGALLMPVDWYSALPFRADLGMPRIKGVTVLRFVLGLQGIAVLIVAWRGWRYTRRADASDAVTWEDPLLGRASGRKWLAVITLLALALRLYGVSSDLWLDEIAPLTGFGRQSVLAILGVFSRSGNHLLNTLLVKLCVAVFGETEWSVRLPAVLFGVATIPVLYWVARTALSRSASLACALLLAVSYHHVFFSQNARGYSAYMFFSLLSAGFLVRALEGDRLKDWSRFVIASVLNAASLLLSGFVIAGHFLTGVGAVIEAGRRRGDAASIIRRLIVVFTVIGLACVTIYALILPQVYAGLSQPYRTATSGFSPLRGEFIAEVVRGIGAGFGPLVLVGAIPFLAIAAVGFVALWRRQWTLAAALASPIVLTFIVFVVRQMTLRPRFFLLAVPVTMLCFVHGWWVLADAVARRVSRSVRTAAAIKGGGVATLTLASVLALVPYYRTPKQAYRATIEFIEQTRRPGEAVIVYGNAEQGFRFYGSRAGLSDNPDYIYLRDPLPVDSVVASRKDRPVYLVFTLARDIRLTEPAFAERLQRDWTRLRVFPATVGDGAITVLRHEAQVTR